MDGTTAVGRYYSVVNLVLAETCRRPWQGPATATAFAEAQASPPGVIIP
jgi:hypothetical protein